MAKTPKTRTDGKPDRRGAKPGQHGQQPHKPTDERRKMVMALVACGCTQEAIGLQFDPPISPDTLQRHYPDQLKHGKDAAMASVMRAQFEIATNTDHKDCARTGEFVLRARAGWRTKDEVLHSLGIEGKNAEGDSETLPVEPSKFTVEFVNYRPKGLPGSKED